MCIAVTTFWYRLRKVITCLDYRCVSGGYIPVYLYTNERYRNTKAIEITQQDIEDISEDVHEIQEDVESIEKDIDEIQEDVEEMSEDVEEISEDVEELSQQETLGKKL